MVFYVKSIEEIIDLEIGVVFNYLNGIMGYVKVLDKDFFEILDY